MKKVTIVLPKVILSFPHLVEKQPLDPVYIKTEEQRKYTATFLLSKKDDVHMSAVKKMEEELKNLLSVIKVKQNPHILIKDGDEEYDAIEDKDKKAKNEYKKGNFIITASNRFQPLLNAQGGEAFDLAKHEKLFYPGCYVHAYIELSPYKFNDVWKGVSNRLQHVQFSKNGTVIGGSGALSGAAEFEKFAEDDDEDDFGTFKQDTIPEKDIF
jgi:hypothetical protein